MTTFLTLEDALHLAARTLGEGLRVGDYGLLESAIARPATSVFGEDAYSDLQVKAAALLHSLARNHPFVDGNKRVAWDAATAFLYINGQHVVTTTDEGYDFVIAVASGELEDLAAIANHLRRWSRLI